MYINTKLLLEKDLTPTELVVLQLIHQNRTEDQSELISMVISDESMEKYTERGFIEYIKGKKSQSEFEKIRISSKGKKLLEEIQIPETSESDIQMANYLMEMYLSHEDEDRRVGNKKKVIMYCTIFRKRMQLTLHQMYWLCFYFLQEYEYTKVLEKVFFDSNKYRYSSFEAQFEDSSLYQFLDEREEDIKLIWKKKGCL